MWTGPGISPRQLWKGKPAAICIERALLIKPDISAIYSGRCEEVRHPQRL